MSSDSDSEAGEWEREQMLRGTQSRRQLIQQKTSKPTTSINVASAKKHINDDMDSVGQTVDSIKWTIGKSRLELAKCEKRIEALKKTLTKVESINPLFEEISTLEDGSPEVLRFIERNKTVIDGLPQDQRELIDILASRSKPPDERHKSDSSPGIISMDVD